MFARAWILTLALLLAMLAPISAHAFSKAIWGEPSVNGVDQFPLYKQLGVRILEMNLNWYQVAPTQPADPSNPADPAYHWPRDVQQAITEGAADHIQVLLQVIGAPAWANGNHPWNWSPRPSAYATFAAAASREYPTVRLWKVWGEPDRAANFLPLRWASGIKLNRSQKVAPHNYARMLDAAYGALKRVNRDNLVIGGSTYTSGDIGALAWIENLRLPNGRAPRMDMYAHNPFGWRIPLLSPTASPFHEVMFPDLQRLAGWIDKYLHRGLPLFLSEYTLPTQSDEEFPYYVTPPTQAKWITDALRTARRWERIYALGWIHLYDDPPVSYGGLLTAQGAPKPGFYAFEHG